MAKELSEYLEVEERDGRVRHLMVLEGWTLQQIMKDQDVEFDPVCGGACECARCHIYVDPERLGELTPIYQDERLKLEGLVNLEDNSRLACRVLWKPELNGLRVTVAPEE